jgi:hypothetical protein
VSVGTREQNDALLQSIGTGIPMHSVALS